jgi:ABC-2 type transport system ATP-binding protein
MTARVGGDGAESAAAEQASRALAELALAGITVDEFSLGQPSLDEVFLALTGHPAEEVPPDQPHPAQEGAS